MSDTTTANYGWTLPSIGASQDTWGNKLNADLVSIDSVVYGLASGYLPIAGGGTLNGNLTIAPPTGYALLVLNKPGTTTANGAEIFGLAAGLQRWMLALGTIEAETGGNAGSNFAVFRYDDGGNLLGEPFSINRATGNVNVAQALAVSGSLTANALSATSVTASNGTFGAMVANSVVSQSGLFQIAPGYALGRGSDSTWRFVENGTATLSIDPSGNTTALGSLSAGGSLTAGVAVIAAQRLNASNGATFLGPGGSGVALQFNPNWYWDWNSSSGILSWNTPGQFWVFRAADNRAYNNVGPVGGIGPYENNSDARGKEDVADSSLGLAEILRLRPVTFKRKLKGDRVELGFIAQELRDVIPEAVSVVGFELPDGSGGIDSDAPSLATTLDPIVATLVNAVKELTERIAALEIQGA